MISIESIRERFWSGVDIRSDDECWNWIRSIGSAGSGVFTIRRKNISAYKMAWELTYGDVPEGKILCHICDNRKCCNPNHLYVGTHKENAEDRKNRGRNGDQRGEKSKHNKLSEGQVIEIIKLLKYTDLSQYKIADMFDISRSTVLAIHMNENWKHVDRSCI
jgi:predicted XRE-type DNA-binding protein